MYLSYWVSSSYIFHIFIKCNYFQSKDLQAYVQCAHVAGLKVNTCAISESIAK